MTIDSKKLTKLTSTNFRFLVVAYHELFKMKKYDI